MSGLTTSNEDAGTIYAAFDNHKMGDFKPHLFKSTNGGRSWSSISDHLPENGPVYALVEDPVNPNLLFAGTEFGLFFSFDGGAKWTQLMGGIPTIAVRDLAIQERETDPAVATFGRGFYILDDYSPLGHIDSEKLNRETVLFPVKRTWMYIESTPLGLREKSFQGDSYETAPNPPFGAIFTYYLNEGLKTQKEIRQEAEKKTEEEGGVIECPTWIELRAEDREEKPAIILTVTDEEGNVVRRLTGPVSKGCHRVAWDLRYPPSTPTRLKPPTMDNPFINPPVEPLVVPGTYKVSLAKLVRGEVTPWRDSQTFSTEPFGTASLPAEDKAALLAFE